MSPESVITQDMRDAIGVDSEPETHTVEMGAVRRFAEAIGDSNPIYSAHISQISRVGAS